MNSQTCFPDDFRLILDRSLRDIKECRGIFKNSALNYDNAQELTMFLIESLAVLGDQKSVDLLQQHAESEIFGAASAEAIVSIRTSPGHKKRTRIGPVWFIRSIKRVMSG